MTEFDSRDKRELRNLEVPMLSHFREPYLQRQIVLQDDGKTITLFSDKRVLVVPKNDPSEIVKAVSEFLRG